MRIPVAAFAVLAFAGVARALPYAQQTVGSDLEVPAADARSVAGILDTDPQLHLLGKIVGKDEDVKKLLDGPGCVLAAARLFRVGLTDCAARSPCSPPTTTPSSAS
ncbi:hypothetical protein DFJ74DRAFT_710220 [Hyaloraphidium curvatum]|nr:hypothetical protein DFJ74DRAFT_710220 [Hyaloraphidium curvatum]